MKPSRKKFETKTNKLQITRKHLLIAGIAAGVAVLVGTVLVFFFGGLRGASEKGRGVATKEAESTAPVGTSVTANPGSDKGTSASKPDGRSGAEKPAEKSDPAKPEGTQETTPSPPPTASATKPEAKPEPESEPGPEPKVEPTVKPKPEPNSEPPKMSSPPPLAAAPFDEKKAKEHQVAWAKHIGVPVEMTNSIGMKLTLIPAGEFQMGSPQDDPDARGDEKPQHNVHISEPFYLGASEVTQEQYEFVMGRNPSAFKGDLQRPVEMISWQGAVDFCQKLSDKEGRTYRLPTEAEWEYACRAGSETKWTFGDDASALKDYACYADNAGRTTHAVSQKKPNAWGLYDMHGNVWEWCADRYSDSYYGESPGNDPPGPSEGSLRVIRGNCWAVGAASCRSACRGGYGPAYPPRDYLGFRVGLTPSVVPKLVANRMGRDAAEEVSKPGSQAGEKSVSPPPKSASPEQRVSPLGDNARGLREVRRFENDVGVLRLGFTEDGQRFFSGGWGGSKNRVGYVICVWDKEKENPIKKIQIRGNAKVKGNATDVALSPTGEYAAVVHEERYFALWNLGTERQEYPFDNVAWGCGNIISARFIPKADGLWVFLAEHGGWDVLNAATGERIQGVGGMETGCLCAAISADGKYAVSGGDGVICLFDLQRRRTNMIPPGAEMILSLTNTGRVTEIALSSDAERAVSRGSGNLRFWDLKNRRDFSPFPQPLVVPAFALSRDGKQLLTAEGNGDLTLWDINAGQSIGQAKATVEVRGSVWPHVVFSPDGRFALSSENQTIRLWSMPDR